MKKVDQKSSVATSNPGLFCIHQLCNVGVYLDLVEELRCHNVNKVEQQQALPIDVLSKQLGLGKINKLRRRSAFAEGDLKSICGGGLLWILAPFGAAGFRGLGGRDATLWSGRHGFMSF